jgi:hypothetical protein
MNKNQCMKPPEIRIKARKPGRIKAALDAWGEASDKFDTDLLDLNDAPPLDRARLSG